MNRRSFIRYAGGTAVLLSTGAVVWKFTRAQAPIRERGISGGRDRSHPENTAGWIAIHDFASRASTRIPLPFCPHKVELHPANHELAFCVEKWGKLGALVNLADKTSKLVHAPGGVRFFGHAVFDPSGRTIYCSAMDDVKREGAILAIDAAELRETRRFPTTNLYPHDCKFVGDALVVANSGKAVSSLAWLRVSDGSVIRSLDLPMDGWATGINHFEFSQDGYAVLSGIKGDATRVPPIALLTPSNEVRQLEMPEEEARALHGEALSIAIDSRRGIAAITAPAADRVCFWNYRRGAWIKSVPLPGPQGIALSRDGSRYVVTALADGHCSWIDASNLTEIAGISEETRGLGANGSHFVLESRSSGNL